MAKGKIFLMTALILTLLTAPLQAAAPKVNVVVINGPIDYSTLQYVERSYQKAEESGAERIIMEIDTPGGLVEAAVDIAAVMRESKVPTAAFVTGGAISAGSLLALTAPELYMSPGTTIGAAEPRVGQEKADEKILSYWREQLAEAAEMNGRDGDVAAAMADADIAIPGVIEKGKLLTLTSKKALELGMIDGVLPDREAVLTELGLQKAQTEELKPNATENMMGWLLNPAVSTILLMIGIAGLVIEFFTVGFGVAGGLGIVALILYFGSHMMAGLSGWLSLLLFIVGIILMAVEALLVPGFGLPGIAGIISFVASIALTAPTVQQAVASLVIALAGTIALLFLSFRFLPTRKLWQRLVLGSSQRREEGYTAPVGSLSDYLDMEGVTLTPLHPAGAVEIGERRVDVVTEGDYIPKGTPVQVVKVEGTRVVVAKIKKS